MNDQTQQHLSVLLEQRLVALNPRGMQSVSDALKPGYLLRAAVMLTRCRGDVIICTGFPVAQTFETDGPAGALALYEFCEQLGLRPWLLAGGPLIDALDGMVRARTLDTFDIDIAEQEAEQLFEELAPALFIVIERPGAASDGRYYNIAGRDITDACRPVEPYVELAPCPVIAIGDGGNEIGMAKAGAVLNTLNIQPSCSSCDELIVADVSNWGAYGLIAMAEYLRGGPILEWLDPTPLLERLVEVGAVDGVTHQPTATEDGLPNNAGPELLTALQHLCLRALTTQDSTA